MGSALPYVNVGTDQTVSSVTTGVAHTCAVLTSGLKCWGCAFLLGGQAMLTHTRRWNNYGQLGLGNTSPVGSAEPQMGDNLPFVDLGTSQKASEVVLGDAHTCALLVSGKVKCWGCALRALLARSRLALGAYKGTIILGSSAKATRTITVTARARWATRCRLLISAPARLFRRLPLAGTITASFSPAA